MEEEMGVIVPGFRFYPTEEELLTFYLKNKIKGQNALLLQHIDRVIPQLHVYDYYPWDLPQYAGERCQGDPEQWFFFIPRQEKEARGGRPSRLTRTGYWKATGSPTIVYSSTNRVIGVKRTMVFYNGRAPTGTKTKWKMNEYKAFQEQTSTNTNQKPELMEEVSLCRVYVKSNNLRAFDRRPSGVNINEQVRIPETLHNNENQATTSTASIHTPIIEMGTTSISDDHSYNSSDDQTVNHSHSTMESTDDQPLWDWDELDQWF
ncbi:NAC domain-containing protein 90-like [Rutidosis leptorrhynchoides]|uniref:NAC domain-containing protein 90-like n=1 Tax=Rutidosis leptorrhynchoides TaxID=125765 RepID=UPI003A99F3C8